MTRINLNEAAKKPKEKKKNVQKKSKKIEQLLIEEPTHALIKPFTPIDSMNPIYLGGGDDLFRDVLRSHNDSTYAEIKEDGYRMQIHKKGDKVKAFTRSKNEILLGLFPELNKSLADLPECILDAELIGYDKIGHNGFNSVKRRFRHKISDDGFEKYLNSGIIGEFPLGLVVFDSLYWEGKSLLDIPLRQRRKYTESIDERLIRPSKKTDITSPGDLKNLFESLVSENYEGLVCKNPESKYIPGKQSMDWIKLKRSETLDLAVVGVYLENEQISQLLCAVYNPDTKKYETLAKVNAKRENMGSEIRAIIGNKYQKTCPKNLRLNPKFPTEQIPTYFVKPENSILVEIASMNLNYGQNWHSAGLSDGKSYSLRIAWLKGIRDDKAISNISKIDLVKKLYETERQ